MSDLRLRWDNIQGRADIVLLPDGTLDVSADLETMVIVSLFTDRRAEPNDRLPGGQTDPRGYWGDLFGAPRDRIGSRLWLLTKATDQTPLLARGYCLEALQWMVEDAIASAVDVQCWFDTLNPRQLDIAVTITRGTGERVNLQYDNIWREELRAA